MSKATNSETLRKLPAIDQVIGTSVAAELVERFGREAVVDGARQVVACLRSELAASATEDSAARDLSPEGIAGLVSAYLMKKFSPSFHHAVNAAGIILHTGLGRAMLARKAVEEVQDVIRGYCMLAVNPETGLRESRDVHVSGLLCELTGAEAATVVNNNAAATLIVLNSLAKGREVIVSRGQLVEIGGSFRMPEVMETSGAVLREVGTTNKTHLRDYANAINEHTGAILRVHTSNYRIVGFTEEPSIREITGLARDHSLPVIDDLGSGALIDLARYGLETEPLVRESIEAGADAVCFSGDKLIGGPQCGIIVGKTSAIEKIKKNPLTRALRVGKMTVAALEATLRLFLNRDRLELELPTYRMLSLTLEELDMRAGAVAEKLAGRVGGVALVEVVDGASQVGSGTVPAQTLPSRLLSVRPRDISAEALAKRLRHHSPPVIARIHRDSVLFDFRTIQPEEDGVVGEAISGALIPATM